MIITCSHNCLACPYPDVPVECVNAPLSVEDFAELEEMDRELFRSAKQKRAAKYSRKHYTKNREAMIKRAVKWNRDHPERRKAIVQKYEANNREKIKALRRQADRTRNNERQEKLRTEQSCIAAYRKARGLSQRRLAELTGISQHTISKWERGIRPANWDRLYAALPELRKE